MNFDYNLLIQLAGIFMSFGAFAKIVLWRLDEIEKKQDKHNKLIERMYYVEQSAKSAHKRLDEACEDIDEMRRNYYGGS